MIKLNAYKIGPNTLIWIKFAGYTAILMAALAADYYFTVANYSKKLLRVSGKIVALETKNTKYGDFGSYRDDLIKNEESIRGLLSGYEGILIGEQRSQNTFLDRISEISVQSRVKLEKIAPGEEKGKKYWDITFKSDYRSICEFFSLAEKYFKIENFKIASGENEPQHKVNTKVSALLSAVFPEDIEIRTKDIFDISGSVMELFSAIKSKDDEAASAQITTGIDPMSFTQTIFPAPVEEKKPEVRKKRPAAEEMPFKVDGIFWDPVTPVVVINGKALKEKEEYDGLTVDKIGEESVAVSWKGKKYNLKK